MKELKDYYDTLGIADNAKVFDGALHTGILRLKQADEITNKDAKGRPYYVIDITGTVGVGSLVAVTKAKAEVDKEGKPILNSKGLWSGYKNYKIETVNYDDDTEDKYSEETPVSRITRGYKHLRTELIKQELAAEDKSYTHQRKVYEKPLYVSEVEYGTDTLTGKDGLGFKDYEVVIEKGVYYRGKPSGVFINLDDIDWLEPKVDTKELTKYAQDISDSAETEHDYFRLPW